jgi:hypothetical protein
MNMQSLLGGIAIGKDSSGNFRPSLKGLAVRIEKNRFVGLDDGQLLDVTPLTFDNADDIVYRMPIKEPKKGDLIVISDSPLRALFVLEMLDNGHLKGLHPINSAFINYAPTANLLNIKFYVKVVSLVDAMVGKTDEEKLLLLSLLGKGDGRAGVGENLLPLLLVQFSGGRALDQDLMRLLLIRSVGTSAGGAAEVLVLQHLMQSLPGTGESTDFATDPADTGRSAHIAERGTDHRSQRS